jgi:ribosomal protein S18 acetylase RimI-like enzyme
MNLSEKQIYNFLIDVDSSFPVPLSQKQDLYAYAKKLKDKATIASILCDERIIAMVAGYTENIIDNLAYISIVATTKDARGRGYARNVLQEFIQICREKRIRAVHLYTAKNNLPAMKLYKKIGFVEYKIENEPRQDDVHLIYFIKES